MAKLIVTRFPATCRKCRKPIAAGTRAYWTKGYGSTHTDCQTEKPTTAEKPSADFHESVIDYAEVRDRYLAALNGDISGLNSDRWKDFHKRWNDEGSDWFGASAEDMKAWISRGYRVEGLRNVSADILPERKSRRVRFAEEGELQVDLALSGFDYPFLQWDKRERKPGMRIEIGVCFNAMTDAELISAYTRWVAQALHSIETAGIDPEVTLTMKTEGAFPGSGPNRHKSLVRVKRENEASDFTNWSAMFSPGGFRHLCFAAEILTGDKNGWKVSSSLGRAMSAEKWDVRWDSDKRALLIGENHNDMRGPFPEEEMTTKLREIMAEISRQG